MTILHGFPCTPPQHDLIHHLVLLLRKVERDLREHGVVLFGGHIVINCSIGRENIILISTFGYLLTVLFVFILARYHTMFCAYCKNFA